jgi:hypothetical protein
MIFLLGLGGNAKKKEEYNSSCSYICIFNNHIKFYAKAEIVYFSQYFEMLSDG